MFQKIQGEMGVDNMKTFFQNCFEKQRNRELLFSKSSNTDQNDNFIKDFKEQVKIDTEFYKNKLKTKDSVGENYEENNKQLLINASKLINYSINQRKRPVKQFRRETKNLSSIDLFHKFQPKLKTSEGFNFLKNSREDTLHMLISTLTKPPSLRSKSVIKLPPNPTPVLSSIDEIFPLKDRKRYYKLIYQERKTYKGIRNSLSSQIQAFKPESSKKLFNNYA